MLTLCMGMAVLLGWADDIAVLKRVLPGLVTMKVNTALCFVGLGLALYLRIGSSARSGLLVARILAAMVLVVGLATTGEYLTGGDWGIDQLLHADDPQASGSAYPGRMSPVSAVNFVLTGASLLVSRSGMASGLVPRWLVVPVVLISAVALMGYAYGVNSLYALGSYSGMALHTAFGFLLLGLGIIAAHPDDGFMAVLTSDSTGGQGARRLLPITTLVLFILGWLALMGQRRELYDASFRLALTISGCMVVTSLVVAWHASKLHGADVLRRRVEAEVRALNATLEQRVEERTRTLQDALTQVRQLGALLPMCSWCNRIRDDQDYWHSVEGYISAHTETKFTHGMCPECRDGFLSEEQASG